LKTPYITVFLSVLIFVFGAVTILPGLQPAQNTDPAPASNQPKNLHVLSKDLTIRQVRAIMEDWTDALGADCSTCHVRDVANPEPGGRPRYDYADDSKQEKRTARVMYAMTADINTRYVSTVPNSGAPVTCGSCHRGHLSPEPYSKDDASAPAKTAK
jgi:Photosynthetic reaction centre cytochrome C subunit